MCENTQVPWLKCGNFKKEIKPLSNIKYKRNEESSKKNKQKVWIMKKNYAPGNGKKDEKVLYMKN